jgi:hypothetical protein
MVSHLYLYYPSQILIDEDPDNEINIDTIDGDLLDEEDDQAQIDEDKFCNQVDEEGDDEDGEENNNNIESWFQEKDAFVVKFFIDFYCPQSTNSASMDPNTNQKLTAVKLDPFHAMKRVTEKISPNIHFCGNFHLTLYLLLIKKNYHLF